MHIENLTDIQALLFVGGVIGFALLLYRLIPAPGSVQSKKSYSQAEITAYDREIPLYFLAAALALILGGVHTVVKNVPGFWQWLWQAGYGGHLFRDLSNSHIIIVGGGTVMLTALTWYLLPRLCGRPLYSHTLAGMSFWFTVIGLLGFYLAWLVLGLVEGNMVTQGWDYLTAKAYLGNWHKLPTAISSSIMGLGYWTYVLNAFLTAFAARHVQHKPANGLTRFLIVAAGGLFIGTVQGVIQVMPANADWIRHAGKFGEYVDPISHAHVNLVTGMMVGLTGFFLYFSERMKGRRLGRASGNLVFWTLVPGSLSFYLSFLLLGLVLGRTVTGYGGIDSPALARFAGRYMHMMLVVSGSAMLLGFWAYFLTLWRGLNLWTLLRTRQLGAELNAATPRAFWLVSSFALVVGTLQGLLQVIPATASFLTVPEEVPNIHAQLNMIGGVLLALIGLVYLLLPELVGEGVEPRFRRRSLLGIASGIGSYYLVTLTTGLVRLYWLRQGLNDAQSALRLGWLPPVLLVITALPMLYGYLAFGLGLWRATYNYRAAWFNDLRHIPDRYNAQSPRWQKRVPITFFLLPELVSAAVGFPGLGWLMAGRGLPGIPLMLCGPFVAWGIIPVLMSPYGDGPLVPYGATPEIIYLTASTLLSCGLLWLVVRQAQRRQMREQAGAERAVEVR